MVESPNKAREKIKEYFGDDVTDDQVDHFLAWLWVEGLMVVPVKDDGWVDA
jgi:hypothetical protein